MYVRGPQHSITGGGSPPSILKWGGEIPPHFARIDAYATRYRLGNGSTNVEKCSN